MLALVLPAIAAAQGTMAPVGRQQFHDANGNPLNGGKLYTYLAGTNTPEPVYQNVTLTTPHANPAVTDASGWLTFYLAPGKSYKFVLKTSADVTIWTQDNIPAVPASSTNQDITGIAGESLLAGELCYLSDGTGGGIAGSWYKADADFPYASTTPQLGFVLATLSVGESGTFRQAGAMTLAGPLTPGAQYFVSATAGAITATAPTSARAVGVAASTTSLNVATNPVNPLADPRPCDGRLTLTSGTPVTTTDVTGAATIYWTPYQGNRCALWNGSQWITYAFTERSLALSVTSGFNADVFVFDANGTLTLELRIWTNDTTRAVALALRDGVYVKSDAHTRRYLGTIRATGTNQTEDSFAKRFVWNYYNRVPRPLRVTEATNSWTYTTATWRQANGSTSNQVAVVIGVAEVPLDLRLRAGSSNDNAGVGMSVGIGQDWTSGLPTTGGLFGQATSPVANYIVGHVALLRLIPAVGYHYYAWLEYSAATGTTTWYGDNGGADQGPYSGIDGVIEG
ncbi:MAG TPA: hypothetical protein VEC57_15055 [Candidatus Limnocylindrales bacterium]|nr:hypothetical protein [Candidatus Limnocylindrales bacterium]